MDCPETDDRFPDRNAEQAEYFGITEAESLAAGKAAKEYVAGLLTGKALTVFTRWASALGSSRLPRYYAVVEVEGRGLAEDLSRFAPICTLEATITPTRSVEIVGEYKPLESGFNYKRPGVVPKAVAAYK